MIYRDKFPKPRFHSKLSYKIIQTNKVTTLNNLLNVQQQSFHYITSANLMAQPAVPVNEDRTDLLGIPPFWAKASVNPPFLWESWIGRWFER